MWATPAAGLEYEAAFLDASRRWSLPAGLLSRVAWQESHYNPDAYNPTSGASGIMQIIPRFHPDVNPWMPLEAIAYAGQLLRAWRDEFGSWALALAAYNAGPGAVRDAGGIPPYPETQQYVAEILEDVGDVDAAGGNGPLLALAFLFLLPVVKRWAS